MKFQYSLPKDEAFFKDYAGLTPTLNKLGYLAQVLSALTEFGLIYALIESSLKDFFPIAAPLAGLFGAVVGTAFLEVGLRKFIPYSVRAILYKRFAGLHLFVTSFIFAVTLGLLGASGYLSFQGSKELVKITAPKPKLESLAPVDSLAQVQREAALRQYAADSLEVVQRFALPLSAAKEKHSAKLAQEALALKRWEARERAEGGRYATQKAAVKTRIAAIQAQQAEELASMEADKAQALGAALKARNKALEGIEVERQKQRQKLEGKNTQAEAHNAQQVKKYGGGLAYFTLIALGVLLLSIAIDEIHKKGAGIEEAALPNQYYFSQSIYGEFMAMLSDKMNYHFRAFIRRMAASTPQAQAPEEAPELWDIPAQAIRRKGASHAAQPGQAPQPEGQEEKYSSIFEKLFSSNGHHNNGHPSGNGQGFHNAARTVVHGFSRPQAEGVHSGMHYNALHYEAAGPVVEVVEVDKASKPCLYCGQLFRPRTTWQKFCSTGCRDSFHEARHGQPFNPGQYQKTKKRKP